MARITLIVGMDQLMKCSIHANDVSYKAIGLGGAGRTFITNPITSAAYLWRYFGKTSCLITSKDSHDDKIQPEGLDHYSVPEPSVYLDPPVNDLQPAESEIAEEDFLADNSREDQLVARDFTHFNRQVRALYYNGWHIETVPYYNN